MTREEIIKKKELIVAGWKDQLYNKSNPSYLKKYSIRCAVVGHIRRVESEIAALKEEN